MDSQELTQGGIHEGHECQRSEEVLTELAVRHPGLSFVDWPKDRVSMSTRASADKLNVIRARVTQHGTMGECDALDRERGKRRGPELPETPLIGVADEGHALGAQHSVRRLRDLEAKRDLFVF